MTHGTKLFVPTSVSEDANAKRGPAALVAALKKKATAKKRKKKS